MKPYVVQSFKNDFGEIANAWIIDDEHRRGSPNPHNLPSGYTEYEYIEASGTQYINTRYVPNSDTEIIATTQRTAVQSYSGSDWGTLSAPKAITAGSYWSWGSATDRSANAYNPDSPFGPLTTRVNISGVYDLLNNKVVDFGTVTWATGDNPVFLFARNNNGFAERYCKVKIFYWAASENGAKKVEFIPARRNSDGVLGMYETVSGTFFTNDGTGVFTGESAS